MARNKASLPAAASIIFKYHSSGSMPWPKIEEAAGKSFSEDERREIFRCSNAFDWEYSARSQAPSLKDVEELRKTLLEHCEAIRELAKTHPPFRKGYEDVGTPDAGSALEIYFGTEAFNFRGEYSLLARSAEQLAAGLSVERPIRKAVDNASPETHGLKAFLSAVLDGADAVDARCNPGYTREKKFKEFSRWGILVGARCAGFPEFVSAVLDREVSSDALRTAWPKR